MGMRNCEIVQQIKYLPGYPDNWKETLDEKLNSNKRIVHWCYIVHDKDTDENGSPIEPHIHLLLILDDSYEPSTIGSYLCVEKNFVQNQAKATYWSAHEVRYWWRNLISDAS